HRGGDGVGAVEGDGEDVAGQIALGRAVLSRIGRDADGDVADRGRRDFEGVILGVYGGEAEDGAVGDRQVAGVEAGDVGAEGDGEWNRIRARRVRRRRGDRHRRRGAVERDAQRIAGGAVV